MRAIFFGSLIFLVWAAVGRYLYVCQVKGHCGEPVQQSERARTLALKDGNKIILDGFDQFMFRPGSIQPELNDNNRQFLDEAADYLSGKPEKELVITGYFLSAEKDSTLNGSFYENLGLARADAIRKQLQLRGMEVDDRVFLDFKETNAATLPEEPVGFTLSTAEGEYTKLPFTFENMTYTDANFEYNSDKFRPGAGFQSYADSVQTFLQLNPEKTLTIIGHTDSIGGHDFNDDLGLRRAKNAGIYFEELGVKSKIKVETRGKRKPVAPNNTEENRQKNRRVNVVIK